MKTSKTLNWTKKAWLIILLFSIFPIVSSAMDEHITIPKITIVNAASFNVPAEGGLVYFIVKTSFAIYTNPSAVDEMNDYLFDKGNDSIIRVVSLVEESDMKIGILTIEVLPNTFDRDFRFAISGPSGASVVVNQASE